MSGYSILTRNRYSFDRPLTDDEASLLIMLVSGRPGSRVFRDDGGAVIAVIAHPEDLANFCEEVRKAVQAFTVQTADWTIVAV
jgi:hypothetical protein